MRGEVEGNGRSRGSDNCNQYILYQKRNLFSKKKVEQERQCFSLNVKLTVLATLEKFWLLENIWDPLHLPECQCCKYGGIKCNFYVGGRDLN